MFILPEDDESALQLALKGLPRSDMSFSYMMYNAT